MMTTTTMTTTTQGEDWTQVKNKRAARVLDCAPRVQPTAGGARFRDRAASPARSDASGRSARSARSARSTTSSRASKASTHIMRKIAVSTLTPGDKVSGIVTGVQSWGAFVDAGVAKDGLLHASEADPAGAYVRDLSMILRVGDRLHELVVKSVDESTGKFTLTARVERPRATPPSHTPVAVEAIDVQAVARAPIGEATVEEAANLAVAVEEQEPSVEEVPMKVTKPSAAAILRGDQRPEPEPPKPLDVVLTRMCRGKRLTLYRMPWVHPSCC